MRKVLVLVECYANECFAEEVKNRLEEADSNYRFKIARKPVYGRDYCVKPGKMRQMQ